MNFIPHGALLSTLDFRSLFPPYVPFTNWSNYLDHSSIFTPIYMQTLDFHLHCFCFITCHFSAPISFTWSWLHLFISCWMPCTIHSSSPHRSVLERQQSKLLFLFLFLTILTCRFNGETIVSTHSSKCILWVQPVDHQMLSPSVQIGYQEYIWISP